jgi:hypothetical protein
MASAQQQILDTLQALLAAGGTVAGMRVFVDRVDPLQTSELPAILIEEAGPEGNEFVMLDRTQRRTAPVTVHCVLSSSTTASADARAFGLAVEKLIWTDAALRTLCQFGIELDSSQTIPQGEGDRLLATRQQQWRFAYRVNPLNPDIINP